MATAEPRLGTDRQQRQRLGNIVDRLEGMQRTGAGITDFVQAGADRGFDVLAAANAGISLPFTPGRNHHRFLATSKVTTICIKSFTRLAPFALQSECLTPKIGSANSNAINLSWMPGSVTDIATHPPQIVAGCCSSVSSGFRDAGPITRSRNQPRPVARACGTRPSGGRLATPKK